VFDVIATAYKRNSLIVTTNLPFENWTEVLGSERLTGAALDRLIVLQIPDQHRSSSPNLVLRQSTILG
jgi:DNA replication protein DnaC